MICKLILRLWGAIWGIHRPPGSLDKYVFTDEALSCLATKFSMESAKPLLTVIFLLSRSAAYLRAVEWCI